MLNQLLLIGNLGTGELIIILIIILLLFGAKTQASSTITSVPSFE